MNIGTLTCFDPRAYAMENASDRSTFSTISLITPYFEKFEKLQFLKCFREKGKLIYK